MRIWGSIEDSKEKLDNIKKKLQSYSENQIIIAIEENYQFSSDKIQKNIIGLSAISVLSELFSVCNSPMEFQILGDEFVSETYTDNGTVYVKYRRWNNSSIQESDEILERKDMNEIFQNSSPIGKEIVNLL